MESSKNKSDPEMQLGFNLKGLANEKEGRVKLVNNNIEIKKILSQFKRKSGLLLLQKGRRELNLGNSEKAITCFQN